MDRFFLEILKVLKQCYVQPKNSTFGKNFTQKFINLFFIFLTTQDILIAKSFFVFRVFQRKREIFVA